MLLRQIPLLSMLPRFDSSSRVPPSILLTNPTIPSMVTIVIPCFNYSQYLGKAIRSVQAQQYSPFEIVVVDDGSTDESATVAKRAGVRLIQQRNAGLGAARNAGLAAASGEFVIFLDADDELLPDALASGVAALRAQPSISCVVRRCQMIDAQDRALPVHYREIDTQDLYREWLQAN